MAEDGYEMMGPGGAGPAPLPPPAPLGGSRPAAPAPPPPAHSNNNSTMSKNDGTTDEEKTRKEKTKNKDSEDTADDRGKEVNQRPSSCDLTTLSILIVINIAVIALTIPFAMTGTGSMKNDAILSKIQNVPKEVLDKFL